MPEKCKRCGTAVFGGANFCPVCGRPMDPDKVSPTGARLELRPVDRRKRVVRGVLIALGLALLLGMGLSAVSTLNGSSSDSGGGDGKTQEEKNQYAREMCDTNDGGVHHVDPTCYASYGGK